jgi:MFS family permease
MTRRSRQRHNATRLQPDFVRLWMGRGVSAVGSEVTNVALPLTAVSYLHANAGELGLLNSVRWLPYLLFALVIGAYADRLRRRRLLLVADSVGWRY